VSLAGPARISESATDEGGLARFSLEFVEAGADTQPGVRADTAGAVVAASGAVKAAAAKVFERQFSTAGCRTLCGAAQPIACGGPWQRCRRRAGAC
jgi:hypothetical protein